MIKYLFEQTVSGKKWFCLPGLFGLIAVVALLFSGPVWAHKVYVFAWVDQGMIHTDSSFGDKKVNHGKIIITDITGIELAKGETDARGSFSFPVPESPTSDLIIKLVAGMGHQALWKVPLKELEDSGSSDTLKKAMEKKAQLEKKPPAENILAGLAVIFGIAFTASIFVKLRKRKRQHD